MCPAMVAGVYKKDKSLSASAGAKYRTGHRDINRGDFLS